MMLHSHDVSGGAITLDLDGVRSTRARSTLRAVLRDLGPEAEAGGGCWNAVLGGGAALGPAPLLVMTDLASCARMFEATPPARWKRAVASAQPFILAFVRNKRDQQYAALVDDIMTASLNRVMVCPFDAHVPSRLRECLSRALAAVDPESIVDVRYSKANEHLWLEFGDGFKTAMPWEALGLEDVTPELFPETATPSDDLGSIQILKDDGEIFDIDAVSVRSLVDAHTERRVAAEEDASLRSIGGQLRAKREQLGLTQQAVAERGGLDQPVISKLERGKHRPRFDTLERYAKGLGLSVAEVLEQARTW